MKTGSISRHICALLLVLLLAVTSSFAYAATDRGDVNEDGKTNANDAALILRSIVHLDELSAQQQRKADYDGDGLVLANDASQILRYTVRLDKGSDLCNVDMTVLVTSDMRGETWSTNIFSGEAQGSALQAASYIDFVRASVNNVLVLDAGNSLFGGNFVDPDGGELVPMTQLFNTVKYDAVLLGNEDFSQGLSELNSQIESLKSNGVEVLAANFLKNDPTTADAQNSPWGGCSPYIIKTYSNAYGDTVRLGVIGLSDTTMDYSDEFFGVGGVEPRSMLDMYRYYEAQLTEQCDVIIVLAHCGIEADQFEGVDYDQSIRALIENTSTIDLVLSGHLVNDEPVLVQNSNGTEIAVMGTGAEPQMVCHAQITYNTMDGRLECALGCIDTSDREDSASLYEKFWPIADKYLSMSNFVVGSLSEPIEPIFDPYFSTDWMTLLHRSSIWNVEAWRDANKADLPMEILSLAYDYIDCSDRLEVGHISAGDLFALAMDKPSISLVLIQGKELRGYLDSYAATITEQGTIYSIYGINYQLNSHASAGSRVMYMEHTYGVEIGDNELFAIIVVEQGKSGELLGSYIDTEWMSWEDRQIPFEIIDSEAIDIPTQFESTRMIIEYLNNSGAFAPTAYTTWSLYE